MKKNGRQSVNKGDGIMLLKLKKNQLLRARKIPKGTPNRANKTQQNNNQKNRSNHNSNLLSKVNLLNQ
uniref:Unkown protein n=1 Tax=Riptortus pedestris TaxID=329032 RepID=R4WJI2_RIPPE|nr:unkown protein [Riptortus pedestris]